MLCPECHKFNPDNNRFCGNCGQPLQQTPTSHYPPEGYDEVETHHERKAGDSLPPLASRVEDVAPVVHQDPTPSEREPVVQSTRTRNPTSIFDLEPREEEKPKFETDPHAVKPISYSSNAPVYEYEVSAERSSALHGPSFLGLGEPDFLDEMEEPESHARRNWLIVALLAVLAIGAMQWRSIRDTGLQYAGTLHLDLPHKKGEQPKQAEQQNADSDGAEANGNGTPEMVVNPTSNSAQGNAQPAPGETIFDSTKNSSEAVPAGKNDNPANTPGTKPGSEATETASAAKNETNQGSGNEADSAADEEKVPPKRATRAVAKREAPKPAEPVADVGADDIARATASSDPATAANWLWAAIKKGSTQAPVLLADYYATGRGVPKDCEQATVLLRSAARRGNPRASARLGMYYATGRCVAQDRAQAWHWLTLAHEGDPGSDWVEQYRQRLWTQMSPDERARTGASRTASE